MSTTTGCLSDLENRIMDELIRTHLEAIRRILVENPGMDIELPFRVEDCHYDPYTNEYVIDGYFILHSRRPTGLGIET